MTAKCTLLDIMKDYDGVYDFLAVRQCANHKEAANMAWDMHKKFMETEDGAGFKRRNALNSDEGDFRADIDAFDVVVTMREDGKYRIVYRIIPVNLNIDVGVE